MQVFSLDQDKRKILRPSPILSKLLDTPDIKRLGMYILKLKQHREDKLQSVNHNYFHIHQHVTNIIFQEQGETMNSASLLMEQKCKEQPNTLGCRASKQLDME